MRLWGRVYEHNRATADAVLPLEKGFHPRTEEQWLPCLTELCRPLDLARPVVMKKHLTELNSFGVTNFRPGDFIETVGFDRFTVEIILEEGEKK